MCYNMPMIDSDDKTTEGGEPINKATDATSTALETGSEAGELVALGIKVVCLALSVIILIMSILTVAMPLSAMRVFNKLGMSERALISAERYVDGRMRGYISDDGLRGDYADPDGNYTVLGGAQRVVDDDFVEAIDLCISLSNGLMTESENAGDGASAVHFAEKLEKYTRVYASMYNNRVVSAEKDVFNVANTPVLAARPYVSDRLHTVYTLNYRARVRTGALDRMLFDYGRNGRCVILTDAFSNTFVGIDKTNETFAWFIDYIGQLDEYLFYALDRLGIDTMSELDFMQPTEQHPEWGRYLDIELSGDEFALFVTPSGGYTGVYENLRNFGDWAQYAVDMNAVTADEKLTKLHAVNVISSVHMKLWYMSMLLYYNSNSYGATASKIREEYNNHTCENYGRVVYAGQDNLIEGFYDTFFNDYASHFRG